MKRPFVTIAYTAPDGNPSTIEVAEGADLVDLPDGGALAIYWNEGFPPVVIGSRVLTPEEAEREHLRRGDTMSLR